MIVSAMLPLLLPFCHIHDIGLEGGAEQSKHQLFRGAVYQLGTRAARDPLYRETLWQVELTWTPLAGGTGSCLLNQLISKNLGSPSGQSCLSLHSGCLCEKVLINNLYFTIHLSIFEDMA